MARAFQCLAQSNLPYEQEPGQMDHNEALQLQAAGKYVLGKLSPPLRDEFEEHFFDCQECARHVQAIRNSEKGGKARPSLALLNQSLVQFGAHRGLQGSHIGGHIVYFYNVSAGEREFAGANVWEDSDEEMGPVSGLAYRGVPRE